MTTEISPPTSSPLGQLREQSSNRAAFEAMQNYMDLPAPSQVVRPEGVFVSVADPDDLLPWLDQLGGVVHVSPVFEDVQMWRLHTFLPPSAGVRVPVWVSVAVPVGESLMHTIVAAVAA